MWSTNVEYSQSAWDFPLLSGPDDISPAEAAEIQYKSYHTTKEEEEEEENMYAKPFSCQIPHLDCEWLGLLVLKSSADKNTLDIIQYNMRIIAGKGGVCLTDCEHTGNRRWVARVDIQRENRYHRKSIFFFFSFTAAFGHQQLIPSRQFYHYLTITYPLHELNSLCGVDLCLWL